MNTSEVRKTILLGAICLACIAYAYSKFGERKSDNVRLGIECEKYDAWVEDRARMLDRIAKQEAKQKAEEEAKWMGREDRIRRFKERNEGVK